MFFVNQRVHPSYAELAGGRDFGVGVVDEIRDNRVGVVWSCGGYEVLSADQLAESTVEAEAAWRRLRNDQSFWPQTETALDRDLADLPELYRRMEADRPLPVKVLGDAERVAQQNEAAAEITDRSYAEALANVRSSTGITANDL
jgi:hypothetical protein